MNVKALAISALVILSGCATTGKTSSTIEKQADVGTHVESSTDFIKVDQFSLMKRSVQVFFFDPSLHIQKRFSNHEQADEKTRLEQWSDYLHNNIIYVFSVWDEQGKYASFYIMRGNPSAAQSGTFYKVDILKMQDGSKIARLLEGYETQPDSTFGDFPVGGSLFEHMAMFQTAGGSRFVGQGVKFYGKFFNVTRYSEIKNAMLGVIKEDM